MLTEWHWYWFSVAILLAFALVFNILSLVALEYLRGMNSQISIYKRTHAYIYLELTKHIVSSMITYAVQKLQIENSTRQQDLEHLKVQQKSTKQYMDVYPSKIRHICLANFLVRNVPPTKYKRLVINFNC